MATFGASLDSVAAAVTFRVFSAHATHLELWVYAQATGQPESLRTPLAISPDDPRVFTKTLTLANLATAGVSGTIYYGFRAWGPNWPFDPSWTPGSSVGFVSDCDTAGNRFNPNKLLLDPYARESSHDPLTSTANDPSIYLSGSAQRNIDTGLLAPKAIVLPPLPAPAPAPIRALKDDIIYEVHVRGLTKNDPSIPPALRGTYAGAALKAPALKALGVTAVEFLPVQESQNETNDLVPSTANSNYWGYEPYAFFAPDRRYAADQTPGGPTREFKQLIDAFHALDIKVFCDVIFNHGGEGDVDGATGDIGRIFTCRGVDNSTYYEVQDGNAGYGQVPSNNAVGRFYRNDNGVSANLNTATWAVRELIMDFLKYWHSELGVDGFRFDLAAVLGNELRRDGFQFSTVDPDSVLQRALTELPARPAAGGPGVDLIAEPYTADTSFNLGQFPSGWSEWNTVFRDTFRTSQNKLDVQNVTPGQLATRFAGSQDLFGSRTPSASINFLTCHDGFSLRDLYSFVQTMNNQLFPFGPSSGGRSASDEICWDQGGDVSLQQQADRNGLAIALLSAGVPMFCGGDELYRTQFGNNNMFNVDTDKNWLDPVAGSSFPQQAIYLSRLNAFRNAHVCLRPANFFKGADSNGNGLKDLTWYQDNGTEVSQAYFTNPSNHFLAFRIDGTEFGDVSTSLLVMYNAYSGDITAVLPSNLVGKRWYLSGDTSAQLAASDYFLAAGSEGLQTSGTYLSKARSLAVFIEQ